MSWLDHILKQLTGHEGFSDSSGFLDTLLENIPMMVFVKEAKELRFVKFNKAGLALLGFEKEDLIGKNDFDFFPEDQARHFTSKDREVLKGKGIVDIPVEPIQTKHQGQRFLHTRKIPIFSPQGEPVYLLGISEDITEKIEAEEMRIKTLAEEAARGERERLGLQETHIANSISSLATNLDYQETLKRVVNLVVPFMADWSVLTVETELGDYVRVAGLHQDPEKQKFVDEFNQSYPPSEKDIEIRAALGEGKSFLLKKLEPHFFEARFTDERKVQLYHLLGANSSLVVPVRSRDRILGALSLSRGSGRVPFDELDLGLAEEIGRRAGTVLENSLLFKSMQEAVKARDEFISIASHELKTPITSLKMQLQMLLRSGVSEKEAKSLKHAVRQIDRLTSLVNDLLDVRNFESGKLSYVFDSFSLKELVDEVITSFKSGFAGGITVHLDFGGNIRGDRYRLEQVFTNLLSNALKYGDGKPVSVRLSDAGDEVVVAVSDQGRGIPLEHQQKIFGKFERVREDANISGLGLGLFISQNIVKAHGGRIELSSEVGKGSVFSVYLPKS